MKCPHCSVNLLMSERQSVEIDFCPECRGVWLDRGELDKIIERSHAEAVAAGGGRVAGTATPDRDDRPRDDRSRDDRGDGSRPPAKKKRTSFLEDIFDF